MKNRLASPTVGLALIVCATVAAPAFAGSNFVSGNKNNDGQYTPRKVRAAKTEDPNREPGFWEKEGKRSGLGNFGHWNPFGDMGNYLKEKDTAYRAKHGLSAS